MGLHFLGSNKVSIIVPVYNAEEHLKNCINSILSQTYRNIEVILINDGSTDSSGIVCDEYSKKDDKIKVIHQKNAGPSVARNAGIDIATGEYIQFVDADDYIEDNMTEKLVRSMNQNVQLTICGYKSIKTNEENTVIEEEICPIKEDYVNDEFMLKFGEFFRNGFINPVWNKLYRKDIIKKCHLYFVNDIKMGEDLLFNLEYIRYSNNISVISEPLYNYVRADNSSLTGNFKEDFFQNQQMLFEKTREFLIENNYYEENKKFVGIRYTDSIIWCLQNLFHENSYYNSGIIKENIVDIVYDKYVRKSVLYFKFGNMQKRLIGILIKHKSIMGIYSYFKIKGFLRDRMKPFFELLKRLNNKHNYKKEVSNI